MIPLLKSENPKIHFKSQLHKMDILNQNMLQTSNSLLSLTKLMAARATNDKQGQPVIDLKSSETINHP